MKSSFIIFLISLFTSIQSNASWDNAVNYDLISWDNAVDYNLMSGKNYHNRKLHLYQGNKADSLRLTGDSHLALNGNSLLSNSNVSDRSSIHMFNAGEELLSYPIIQNTKFNDQSHLIMETGSISAGYLIVEKNARLNIKNVHRTNGNISFGTPEISGNVYIGNLNLAGKAFISPSSEWIDKHDDNDYHKQTGDMIITHIDHLVMQPGSSLSMEGYIPQMQFNQLKMNTLSGSGDFILSSHLAGGLSDKIIVHESASGRFGLTIEDSGYEPITPQRVPLICIDKGDAHFDLLNSNGIVEAGVWQYTLQHNQTAGHSDWYLSPEYAGNSDTDFGKLSAQPASTAIQSTMSISHPVSHQPIVKNSTPTMSRSAQAVMNMASASRYIMSTEMSSIHQRRKDISYHGETFSLWMRYLKNSSHFTTSNNSGFHAHLQGVQIGLDNSIRFNYGRWLLGGFLSDSNTAIKSEKTGQGNINSESGGLYAAWLDNSGFYWDNALKINKFSHEINVTMNNNQITTGQYHQYGFTLASEVGYLIPLTQMLALTPYGKTSYFRTSKVDHVLDNGLATTLPKTSNLDGEAGVVLGVPFSLKNSRVHPYLKIAISRELVGDNTLMINGITLPLPDTGTCGKYGLGSTLQIADNLSAWAEMDYQKGNKIESPVNASLGIQFSF